MKKWFVAIFLFISISGFSQVNLDSLFQVWENDLKPDTVRFEALNAYIVDGYVQLKPDTCLILVEELLKKTKEKKSKKWEAKALNTKGIIYKQKKDYDLAIEYFTESLELRKAINDKSGMAVCLTNIGLNYKTQGNNFKALLYYEQALELFNKGIVEKKTEAILLNNIGIVHFDLAKHAKALEYFNKSLEIQKELNNMFGVLYCLERISGIYHYQENFEKALEIIDQIIEVSQEMNNPTFTAYAISNKGATYVSLKKDDSAIIYLTQSLEMAKELGNKSLHATILGNMSQIYLSQKNYSKASELIQQAIELSKELNDERSIAFHFISLAYLLERQGKYSESIKYGNQALKIYERFDNVAGIRNASRQLFLTYKSAGDGTRAVEMHEQYIQMRDSIKSEEVAKELAQAESRAEFEKELLIKEQEEKELARIEAEKVARRNSLQYSGIGLGIFALFGLVFFLGKIKLPNWAVELSVFLPFLIFFEFLLVITDNKVEVWSGGEPLIKLALNVLMAAAIFPLHSFFETFLKKRLFKPTP